MQDAADEISLRDEEGVLRASFLHAVEAALDADDAKTVRELTLDLHEADLADLIQLLRPDLREPLIATLGRDFNAAALVELDEGVTPAVNTSTAGGALASGIAGTLGNILEGAESIARTATNRIPPDTSIAGAVNGTKTGAWTPEEAYQYLALGGLSPAQIDAAFTTRGVAAPTPNAPANTAAADGAPVASGGGSGGGGGSSGGGSSSGGRRR